MVVYSECLPIYQISNSKHLLEYIWLIVHIVVSDKVSMLVQESLSKAILAFLNWLQVLDAAQDFIQVFLQVLSDVVRFGTRRNDQDVCLLRCHLILH